jgi:signal transduction histidine kinase
VQRGRLRALAGGYAAIVFILLIAGFGGSAVHSLVVQWLFEVVALIALPLLLAAFNPPRWLRQIWAQSEVDELRGALHELVLFSPDRPTLAGRGLEWAIRLVGADGGAVVDPNGTILAIKGMEPDAAGRLAAQVDEKTPKLTATPGSIRENAMVLPLRMDAGTGTMVIISGPFTPFFGTDELLQVHAYGVNVTAALDRARVTERLSALDRMKSQFLNLASHELRSPLGVISGYVSMLEQGSFGPLKEPGVRAVEIIKAKALEMNLLVAQMLDAARLEEGKLTLKRDNLDLRRIVDQAVEVVKPMATSANQLAVDSPVDEVPVFGDPDRLLTIITNLTENAVKYSPDGSQVVLRVWSQDGSAKVSVSDTGIGIAHEDLPRLFNRFERLQHPQTRHVGGTGLGLYLSRELARQHGGDIEVNSEEGRGSTFTLVLPLTRPLPQSETEMPEFAPEAAPLPAPRLKVLSAEVEETRPA